MRSFWIQLIVLLVYLIIVFLISRILEFVPWYQSGSSLIQTVDPFTLSVQQLKQLLESRGISQIGYVEKNELADLVKESDIDFAEDSRRQAIFTTTIASVSQGELKVLDHVRPVAAPAHFTGAPHFYEQVEDTKDSVWLVQVVQRGEALLDDGSWQAVCAQVAPFAIRTGVFDCRLDMRLCNSKGWQQPLLLLAMPKGTRSKDKVILKTFSSKKPQSVIEWVRDELSVRVQKVEDLEEARCDWLHECEAERNGTGRGSELGKDVRMLLLTYMLHPPLFLAALSIKFTGRIKFGMLSIKKSDLKYVHQRLRLLDQRVPAYLLITPEKKIVYGQSRLEYFNFNSMNLFLKAVQPEMNDIFLCSLVVTNLLAILQTCQVWECLWWKHVAQCVWIMFSYNFWFFTAWLLILATYKFSVMNTLAELGLMLVHYASLTEVGSLVRSDCFILMQHPYVFFVTFAMFAFVAALVLNHFYPVEEGAEVQWVNMLPIDSRWIGRYLFRPMGGFSVPVSSNDHVREELEWLIERLAVPNLWLQPVVPQDYVKSLPVWRFKGWDTADCRKSDGQRCRKDSPAIIEKMMDGQDPREVFSCSCCTSRTARNDTLPCYKLNENKAEMCTCHCVESKTVTVHHSCDCPRLGCSTSSVTSSGTTTMYSSDTSEDSGDEATIPPAGMRPTSECAVCLELYENRTWLCGLPCGHTYHQDCIMVWLMRDNHHCPVCRWPAFKQKHQHSE